MTRRGFCARLWAALGLTTVIPYRAWAERGLVVTPDVINVWLPIQEWERVQMVHRLDGSVLFDVYQTKAARANPVRQICHVGIDTDGKTPLDTLMKSIDNVMGRTTRTRT